MAFIPKIRIRNRAILGLFSLFVLLTPRFAIAENSLDELRADHIKLTNRVQIQEAQLEKSTQSLEAISTEIQKLKDAQKVRKTFFGGYELRKKLQAAQELSERIESIRQELRVINELYLDKARALALGLEREMEEKRRSLHNSAFQSVRQTLAREIAALHEEHVRVAPEPASENLPVQAKSLFENGDNQNERAERLLAIRDFEKKLSTEAKALQESISDYQRKRFIRNEIGYLLDEESFFAERGFIRGRTARAETDTGPLARTQPKEGEESTPENGDTTAVPTEESPAEVVVAEDTLGDQEAESSVVETDLMEGDVAAPSETVDTVEVDAADSEFSVTEDQITASVEDPDALLDEQHPATSDLEGMTEDLALVAPESENVPDTLDDFQDLIERDSLARLASDLGLMDETMAHEMNRVLADNGNSSGVVWLKLKLKLTEQLLEILRAKADELESKLDQ